MIRCMTLFRLSLLMSLLISGPAAAIPAPAVFTDEVAWAAAAGGATTVLADFNGFGSDTSFGSSLVDVGSFSMAQVDISLSPGGLPMPEFNLVDAPAFFSPDLSLDGTPFARGFVNDDSVNPLNSRAIWMTSFDLPFYAWGADFTQANGLAGLTFRLITESEEFVDIDGPLFNGTGFWGFVGSSSDPYTELIVFAKTPLPSPIFGEDFGMDNVVGAEIPEPTPAAMISLGLVLMAVHRRRRIRR